MSASNTSLYVHNLNDKVNKDELCLQLYSLFSTYGSIIDVVAQKGSKMKGQAFVVFADLASATAALRSCEGMSFYSKPMRIEYAKSKSYATLKREDPDFVTPSVLRAQAHPPTQLMSKVKLNGGGPSDVLKRPREGEDESDRSRKRANGHAEDDDEEMEIEEDEERDTAEGAKELPLQQSQQTGSRPTSNVLVCTNLPQEVTDDVLAVLFQQYRGFQSTAVGPSPTPPAKLARVYFDSPEFASTAKDALDGFTLKKGWSMAVAFA